MSYRSRSDGSHYPLSSRSLYNHSPRSSTYSRNIDYGNQTEAKDSVAFANQKWAATTSKEARVHLIQAMNEAAIRAKVMKRTEDRKLHFTLTVTR